MTSLVRSERTPLPEDLQTQLTALEARRGERLAEISRTRIELDAFRVRYRQEVGTLHEELDDLERAIAEAELGELSKLVEDAGQPATPTDAPDRSVRYTSDSVRRLFRDVAKTIHPDLAQDEDARSRRHALMVEANRAYAVGDEDGLRSILDEWESSPEALTGTEPQFGQLRLVRRVAQLERQLASLAHELRAMHGSPLWQLKTMVDEATSRGKDLVADMVRRLRRDIVAARNRLEAMRWKA